MNRYVDSETHIVPDIRSNIFTSGWGDSDEHAHREFGQNGMGPDGRRRSYYRWPHDVSIEEMGDEDDVL